MKLQFWGAAQTVTGSMHLITVNGYNILLDCGIYHGRRKEAFERNRTLPFEASSIDVVILSHAHIDHSGNLPSLVKQGYDGPIWTTSATRDLCAIMLPDSAHIQENDVKYVNKRRKKQRQKLFEPLYSEEDVLDTLEMFQTVGYNRPFYVVPGVKAHFREAGHMLGSASIVLDIDDKEDGQRKRLAFSGDVGRPNSPLLRDPVTVDNVDTLIMESTYGNRYHESHGRAKAALKEEVLDIMNTYGKIIIPSFAVGRTQEIVYALHQLINSKEIPPIDIYVDSPLAVNATEIFRLHPELYDQQTRQFLNETNSRSPFAFEQVTYIRKMQDSKMLNDLIGPAVIISASGMCEAGRILHHLKNNIGEPRNTILFVGYQAEHTLGRKILDGHNIVPIFGSDYKVRAKIVRIEGYSAHADHNGLLNWLKAAQSRSYLKKLFLVHGEPENTQILAQAAQEQGVSQVYIPERGQKFTV